MANLSITPMQQFLSDDGLPLNGCLMYTYIAGSNTPKDTYTDYDSNIVQTNPIVADAAGRMEIWLGTGLYKLTLRNSVGDLIWTVDNVGAGGGGSSFVVNTVVGAANSLKALSEGAAPSVVTLGYRAVSDGISGLFRWDANSTAPDDGGSVIDGNTPYSTGRWIRVMEGEVDPRQFGAYGNSTDNDKPYVENAVTYAKANGLTLKLTKGNYLISSTTDLALPIKYDPYAKFIWTNFSPDTTAIIGVGDYTQHFDVDPYTAPIFPAGFTVDPRTFGATIDGVTDDNDAISDCISALRKGGTISMPKGTMVTNNIVQLMPNQNLIGETGAELKIGTAFSGAIALINNQGNFISNVAIKNLTVTGDGVQAFGGIAISGSNITIEDCTIKNTNGAGIIVGNVSTATDTTSIIVRNNCLTDTSGVTVIAGQGITVEGNEIKSVSYNSGILVHPLTAYNASNLSIRENKLTGCNISVLTDSRPITNINIQDNLIDGALVQSGINLEGPYPINGVVGITGNELNLSATDSTGIRSQGFSGTNGLITISENQINAAKNKYGIALSNAGGAVICANNAMNLTDGTGIGEASITDASYGTNIFMGSVKDWYDVSQPRYCTLGTNFRSQIDGDTTCDSSNTVINGNVIISGSIVNNTYNGLFATLVSGLDMTNVGIASSQVKINPGSCTSTGGYLMTLDSTMVKDTTAIWTAGQNLGGMGYNAYGGKGTGGPLQCSWHVFLLGKSTDPAAIDAGFDDNTSATNLMAQTAGAGFDQYRRLGAVYRGTYFSQIAAFWQYGEEIVFRHFQTFAPGADQPYTFTTHPSNTAPEQLQMTGVPYGLPLKLRINVRAENDSNLNSLFVGDGGADVLVDNVIGDFGFTNTTNARTTELWCDSTGRISVQSAKNESMTCSYRVMGWTDNKFKY